MNHRGQRIRRIILPVALLVLGAATVAMTWLQPSVDWQWDSLSLAVGGVLVCYGFFSLRAIWKQRDGASAAGLQLDWYWPVLRRAKKQDAFHTSPFGDWVRQWLPAGWVSDRVKKKQGWLRKWARRVGRSWVAVPHRRVVQVTCWLLFMVLFFYVCWPYSVTQSVESPIAETQAHHSTTVSAADTVVQQEVSPLVADGSMGFWPDHYTRYFQQREFLPADLFLVIDPLVAMSTLIASGHWVWSLTTAAVILIVCLLVPRGFCGYLCPLGTTIDLFDWAIGKRIRRFRLNDASSGTGAAWWVHLKYYLLIAILVAAINGVLISGYFSAIPVLTRGMLFGGEPIQSGLFRGWHLVPAFSVGQWLSLLMFLGVLGLGLLQPRFWCKYVCPSGAVFSLGNLFRLTERKVESSCIHCNKCIEVCPFDAIKPDFTTRTADCTLCQTCAGVCPTHAIKFVDRNNLVQLKTENDPPTNETKLGRRGFLSTAIGGTAAVASGVVVSQTVAASNTLKSHLPIRPPGSVPESDFLEMCIRCGECFKVCPNNVLQAEGFQQGLAGLWTPLVNPDWAGCESSCNACGQVCPTGAIRALPLEEKREARMGLAEVNLATCLPHAGTGDCDLCVVECQAAGYDAIEYLQVGTEVDGSGNPVAGTGRLAPVVLADKCVGCGLCQTRCVAINVKETHQLEASAIVVRTGPEKEDRIREGSYVQLKKERETKSQRQQPKDVFFVPEEESVDENPFF